MLSKSRLSLIVKMALSVGLISWLLSGADLPKIWHHIESSNLPLLIFAFVMFYIGYFISACRWKMLMKAQGIDASIGFLLQSFTVGIFFNNFLPSTIGGDASRMYDVWRLAGDKTKAVSIILTDRFFGMFSLLSFGFLALQFTPKVQQAIPGVQWYLGGVLTAMIVVLWMIFGGGDSVLKWFLSLRLGPFGFMQRLMKKVSDALSAFRGRTDVLKKAILLSFLLQLNVILHFVLIVAAMNLNVPVVAVFVIIPIAVVILLLPVSINGVGVRETVYVFLFGIFAVSTEHAIAYAWVALAMLLAQGVVGGVVFALRKQK
ncbi:MAG: lysylphosphatidylglycerol synthase transmembrane domain-containing protein [Pseudomonadota bacterium]